MAHRVERKAVTSPPRLTRGRATLVVSAFFLSLLAVFQWMELLVLHHGGTLSCAINSTLDCRAIWSSSFAKVVQSGTGIPVAGWGLAWGLVAFASGVWLWTSSGLVREGLAAAVVRWVAAVGLVASLVFAGVSASIGALCVTCIVTYWLTFVFAFAAWRLPYPLWPKQAIAVRSAVIASALAGMAYAALLFPGRRTPSSPPLSLESVVATLPATESKGEAPEEPPKDLATLIERMPPGSLQLLSDGLARVRQSKPRDTSAWRSRFSKGPADAPVTIVEFTDIKCGHCARLVMELAQLEQIAPRELYRVEPRQYPLDAKCNPALEATMTEESGVRCTAAKALICLEGTETYWSVQHSLFATGPDLTNDRVLEVASGPAGGREALERCIASTETATKLAEDLAYANAHDIHGTPLVLVQGREIPPAPAFIYAMILARGDPNATEFSRLPPPKAQDSSDPHAGHAH